MDRTIAPLPEAFLGHLRALEKSYLSTDDPIRQCGFSGERERWKAERRIILDAIDSGGDFIDVGCANGYLLSCLTRWAKEKGVHLTPFGLDYSKHLVELARNRFPELNDRVWVGNAWEWIPPRKFRYVYTLCDCVPDDFFCEYLRRLLTHYVTKPGRVIVGAHGSSSEKRPARDIVALIQESGLILAGRSSVGSLPITNIAWIDSKQP
jgi:SAM-dependent methyltransferase